VVIEPSYQESVQAQGLVSDPIPGVQVAERVAELLALPVQGKQKIQSALDCGEQVSSGQIKSCK
jgi:hypothetical protein